MIALIIATKKQIDPGFSKSTLIGRRKLKSSLKFSNTCILVCPLSVLSNWEKQIEDHCAEGAISIYVYYGTNRNNTVDQLQEYDVVLTTYQTVAGELDQGEGAPKAKKRKNNDRALFDVPWKVIASPIRKYARAYRNSRESSLTRAIRFATQKRKWPRAYLA